MESKAQKAALSDIETCENSLIEKIMHDTHDSYYIDILTSIDNIANIVKEYGLENKLLTDLINNVYDALMKKKRYSNAASFAKKYGL